MADDFRCAQPEFATGCPAKKNKKSQSSAAPKGPVTRSRAARKKTTPKSKWSRSAVANVQSRPVHCQDLFDDGMALHMLVREPANTDVVMHRVRVRVQAPHEIRQPIFFQSLGPLFLARRKHQRLGPVEQRSATAPVHSFARCKRQPQKIHRLWQGQQQSMSNRPRTGVARPLGRNDDDEMKPYQDVASLHLQTRSKQLGGSKQ